VTPSKFEPDERERKIIEHAIEKAELANQKGHHAPDELVARMTSEDSLAPCTPPPDHASADFRIVLAVAVDEPIAREDLKGRLRTSACTRASVFKAPRHVVLMEFSSKAATREAAVIDAVKDILMAFQQADFVDLNDQNALLDELVDGSSGMPPTESELRMLMNSSVPSNNILALATAAAGAFQANAVGLRLQDTERVTEADVFELLPGIGLVHLMTDGGTILSLTAGTPGIASLQAVMEGHRYRCWVRGRFDVVVRAELIS